MWEIVPVLAQLQMRKMPAGSLCNNILDERNIQLRSRYLISDEVRRFCVRLIFDEVRLICDDVRLICDEVRSFCDDVRSDTAINVCHREYELQTRWT